MTPVTPLRGARNLISRPSLFHPKPDSTALLLRWLTRHALVSEAHASVVAELAFYQGRAA
jgi:hypothetical protein